MSGWIFKGCGDSGQVVLAAVRPPAKRSPVSSQSLVDYREAFPGSLDTLGADILDIKALGVRALWSGRVRIPNFKWPRMGTCLY